MTHHETFVLINIYAPALRTLDASNGSTGGAFYDTFRQASKSAFHWWVASLDCGEEL